MAARRDNHGQFLFDLFAEDIIIKRNQNDLSLITSASEIGIGKTTLSELERKSKVPSVVIFSLVIKWLDNPADKYFLSTNPSEL